MLGRRGKSDVLRFNGRKRESNGVNEGIVMEIDVLIGDLGDGISFIGFKDKIELLRVRGEKRKLSGEGG